MLKDFRMFPLGYQGDPQSNGIFSGTKEANTQYQQAIKSCINKIDLIRQMTYKIYSKRKFPICPSKNKYDLKTRAGEACMPTTSKNTTSNCHPSSHTPKPNQSLTGRLKKYQRKWKKKGRFGQNHPNSQAIKPKQPTKRPSASNVSRNLLVVVQTTIWASGKTTLHLNTQKQPPRWTFFSRAYAFSCSLKSKNKHGQLGRCLFQKESVFVYITPSSSS